MKQYLLKLCVCGLLAQTTLSQTWAIEDVPPQYNEPIDMLEQEDALIEKLAEVLVLSNDWRAREEAAKSIIEMAMLANRDTHYGDKVRSFFANNPVLMKTMNAVVNILEVYFGNNLYANDLAINESVASLAIMVALSEMAPYRIRVACAIWALVLGKKSARVSEVEAFFFDNVGYETFARDEFPPQVWYFMNKKYPNTINNEDHNHTEL